MIKVCEHFKNKFAPVPEGIEFILITIPTEPSFLIIEYLKHLKESQSCYAYSGLAQPIDDVLNRIKNNLQEMLKMLE